MKATSKLTAYCVPGTEQSLASRASSQRGDRETGDKSWRGSQRRLGEGKGQEISEAFPPRASEQIAQGCEAVRLSALAGVSE